MKKRKRVTITVDAGIYEEIQEYVRKAGLAQDWLSREINAFMPGLLGVIKEAYSIEIEKSKLTEKEQHNRYLQIIKKNLPSEERDILEKLIPSDSE